MLVHALLIAAAFVPSNTSWSAGVATSYVRGGTSTGTMPGVDLAGILAEEIQLHQIFAAAVVAGSKELVAAKRLIAFLASDRAAPAIRSGGMEPLGKRH